MFEKMTFPPAFPTNNWLLGPALTSPMFCVRISSAIRTVLRSRSGRSLPIQNLRVETEGQLSHHATRLRTEVSKRRSEMVALLSLSLAMHPSTVTICRQVTTPILLQIAGCTPFLNT